MTSPFHNLLSTKEISENSKYFDSPESFFANFDKPWKTVLFQVLKVETKQSYDESGDPSFEILKEGDLERAIKLLKELPEDGPEINERIKKENIDFIRCRPVMLPLTDYLKWEFESYKISVTQSQRIFCVLQEDAKGIFDKLAMHDFMVFDRDIAFIHNYDENGLIRGGWLIDNPDHINNLIFIFSLIKCISTSFPFFLEKI